MPIYEFACPKCRKIFSFLSKRIQPEGLPACPKCGNKKMARVMSRFATLRGVKEPSSTPEDDGPPVPEVDEARMERAMAEIERDMEHLDENNPRHMAHVMKKMKDALPPGLMPKELDVAIKRLEKGEDPEKIEADMGDVLDQAFGPDDTEGMGGGGGMGGYSRDSGLYDY